ncbi:MAG: hypothetical protein FD180_232 [Planctomycetota bacterium]|nr:MAG: hypothetical protein FD180_232 [Planctomycetota bacterium]
MSRPARRTLKQLEASLRARLHRHLRNLGYSKLKDGTLQKPEISKESFRALHAQQRKARFDEEKVFVRNRLPELVGHFASGSEIRPEAIAPELELVASDSWQSDLFRLATLTWSVPVSQGYGRRMRFLVWDRSNSKLIGIIALGDPVFNLRVRDALIGWDVEARKERLVNIMDAYVLGAIPPYNALLGGKLVASLVRSLEVRNVFRTRYGLCRGIISKQEKNASLVMVTTSSALGRSAVYNRLVLDKVNYMESIGFTSGWGHFHIPDKLFSDMRSYLKRRRHAYSNNHQFGNGPNWRFRAVREVLSSIGVNPSLLLHGISREVFVSRLAKNAEAVLLGEAKRPNWSGLLSVDDVSEKAISRWIVPRAQRRPEFAQWNREMTRSLLERFSQGQVGAATDRADSSPLPTEFAAATNE